jgi:hypothetical protein
MPAHCHKLVAKVAQEAAGELYERLMGENLFFEEWKRQNPGLSPKALESRFISKNWGRCIGIARATLALLLRSPLDSKAKEDIMEALVLDSTLKRGRQG